MMSSIRKRIEALEHKQKQKKIIHWHSEDDETVIIHAENKQKIYVPTKTGKKAHEDKSFFRCMMGPYGSGKTTWALIEILKNTVSMPGWKNGRRRSRWAIVRNTSGELVTTTLHSWLQWFGDLGDIHSRQKPIITYEHLFNDERGTVELEILFLALDRPDHVRKVKSLELTGCYINEISEVPKAILEHMTGRVGRYPSRSDCPGKYWSGIIADTNPPDEDHWLYKHFEEKKTEGNVLFRQPPGLVKNRDGKWITNLDADNIENLPVRDYYERLATGKSEDFIKVFCLGQYGTVSTGKRVYQEFNSDLHAAEHIEAVQGEPLYLGWDFGLTPACVVCQMTQHGQLLVLKEYTADGMGIRSFAESVVLPGLKKDFPYCKVGVSRADPAGNARSEIIEEMSCINELCSTGIDTEAASTNDIETRLGAVRYFLNRMADGKPSFQIDRKNCPVLFKGFAKDYVYRRLAVVGEERYHEKPDKNMASHPMDALGYICLYLASTNIASNKKPVDIMDIFNPVARQI